MLGYRVNNPPQSCLFQLPRGAISRHWQRAYQEHAWHGPGLRTGWMRWSRNHASTLIRHARSAQNLDRSYLCDNRITLA